MRYFTFFCLFFLGLSSYGQENTLSLEIIPGFFQAPPEGNIAQPRGVAVNSKGHIFIFNTGHYQLMEFNPDGVFVRAIGQGLFIEPHGLRIDREDNIWTTDLETHMVMKFDPDGRLLMALGEKGTSGLINEARKSVLFFKPADVGFARNGDIYVADGYGNHRVVKLDRYGQLIKSWGKQGPANGDFDNPHNIVVDGQGKVYVADRNNSRIQVFSGDGEFIEAWTDIGRPWGLALSHDNYIYMSEGDAEKILKLDLDGNIIATYHGGSGHQPGQFIGAHGIALGPQDEIFVTSVFNYKVQKFEQVLRKGPWHRIKTIRTARRRSESAFIEVAGKFYAIGGRNNRALDIYDPATNTWSKGADTPQEIHHFQAIEYQNEIWVIGAFTGPFPKEQPVAFIHVYNPEQDRWRTAGRLPEGRHRGAAGVAVFNDKIFLLCGNTLGHWTGHTTWFDEFDPATGEWRKLPDAPHTRDHFQAAVLDGKLYAAGGRNSSHMTGHVMDQTIAEVDVYDFATQQWSTLPQSANLPTLRAGTTTITMGDRIVVLGGESTTQVPAHNEVEAYDVSDRKWHALPSMLTGRHGTQAFYYDGKVFITGGAGNRGGGPELNSLDCWELK